MSVTMLRSSPNKALTSEDLPTFGCPTMAILGKSVSKGMYSSTFSTTASNSSPVPEPDIEEMKKASSKPMLQNSLASIMRSPLSTLLTMRKTGFFDRRKRSATSSSRSVTPVVTSTMKSKTEASSIAKRTCERMAASNTSSEPSTKPPVSMMTNFLPFHSVVPYFRSRVTPDSLSTMASRCPTRRL